MWCNQFIFQYVSDSFKNKNVLKHQGSALHMSYQLLIVEKKLRWSFL